MKISTRLSASDTEKMMITKGYALMLPTGFIYDRLFSETEKEENVRVAQSVMNGHQKGAILNDCMSCFCGTKPQNEDISGVIELQDMGKITEHTYGSNAYMRLKLNGVEYEITAFFREEGESYKTSADGTENREKVINAFRHLY